MSQGNPEPKRPAADRPLSWWGDRLCTYGTCLRIGDDLPVLGHIHRIVAFEPYDPARIGLEPQGGWRIARAADRCAATIEPHSPYEVLPQPGEAVPEKIDTSGTWGIRYTDQAGVRRILRCMVSETTAKRWETELEPATGGDYREVQAFDRLAELTERLPIGAKVIHRSALDLGIGEVTGSHRVTEHYGPDDTYTGDQVNVSFPGHGESTWVAHYIDRADGEHERSRMVVESLPDDLPDGSAQQAGPADVPAVDSSLINPAHTLTFDTTTPEGQAICQLFQRIKVDVEEPDGNWPGIDLTDTVTQWLTSLGFDLR